MQMFRHWFFISENIALQARGLGESSQVSDWFEKNYNSKQLDKEKSSLHSIYCERPSWIC